MDSVSVTRYNLVTNVLFSLVFRASAATRGEKRISSMARVVWPLMRIVKQRSPPPLSPGQPRTDKFMVMLCDARGDFYYFRVRAQPVFPDLYRVGRCCCHYYEYAGSRVVSKIVCIKD